jgi:hypothetical protein
MIMIIEASLSSIFFLKMKYLRDEGLAVEGCQDLHFVELSFAKPKKRRKQRGIGVSRII